MRNTFAFAALVLSLASCNAESTSVENATPPSAPAAASQSAATSSAATATPATSPAIEITRNDGGKVATLVDRGEGAIEITIAASSRVLRAEPRTTGKRKYHAGDGPVIVEVKPDDKGFKVRNADGSLRWKVRIADDKIKVSNNEQNENAFELKMRPPDRVKVVAPGERELGDVRFDRAETRSKVETAGGTTLFRIKGPHYSAAWGVLLLDTIPEDDRYVIVAELLSRGR